MGGVKGDGIEKPRNTQKRCLHTELNEHKLHENSIKIVKKRKYTSKKSKIAGKEGTNSSDAVAPSKPRRKKHAASSSTKSVNENEESHEIKCTICMDTEDTPMFLSMSCNHTFHSVCILTWLKIQESCPICMPYTAVINSTFEVEDLNEFHEGLRCVICMDTAEYKDFESKSCGHSFHSVCSQTWSQEKDLCPICMPFASVCNMSNTFEDEIECISEFCEDARCMICLDTVKSSNFEFISCCHSFHTECIKTWFGIRKICPVCMVDYTLDSNVVEEGPVHKFHGGVGCTICMDAEVSSDFQNLGCGHEFHTVCTQTWFNENNMCPLCAEDTSANSVLNTFKENDIEIVHCADTEKPSNNFKENDDDEVRCAICVDTEDSTEYEFLVCCHSFHSECIKSWFKKKKSCPICKTPAPESSIANTFANDDGNTIEHERLDPIASLGNPMRSLFRNEFNLPLNQTSLLSSQISSLTSGINLHRIPMSSRGRPVSSRGNPVGSVRDLENFLINVRNSLSSPISSFGNPINSLGSGMNSTVNQ